MRRRIFLDEKRRKREILEKIQARQRAQLFAAKDAASKVLSNALGMGLRTAALCLSVKAKPNPKQVTKPSRGLKKLGSQNSMSPYRRARELISKGLRFHDTMYRRKTVFTDGWKNPANNLDYSNIANGTSKTPISVSRSRSKSPHAAPSGTDSQKRILSFRLPQNGDGDSIEKGLSRIQSSPHILVNSMHIPNMPPGGGNVEVNAKKPTGANIPIFAVTTPTPVVPSVLISAEEQETIDTEHEKALRLALLHKQREDEMEAERAARLKLIEEVSDRLINDLTIALTKEYCIAMCFQYDVEFANCYLHRSKRNREKRR